MFEDRNHPNQQNLGNFPEEGQTRRRQMIGDEGEGEHPHEHGQAALGQGQKDTKYLVSQGEGLPENFNLSTLL